MEPSADSGVPMSAVQHGERGMNERDGPVPISRTRRPQILSAEAPPLIAKVMSGSDTSFDPCTTTSWAKGFPSDSSSCSDALTSAPPIGPNRLTKRDELSQPSNTEGNGSLREDIIAAIPNLRAFAMSLSGNIDNADDLVQETLLRALAHIDSFEPGTNLAAWLFTILRNLFRSEYRKRKREVEDGEGRFAATLKTRPEQSSRLEFKEFQQALAKIPADQREALILVGASGFSYEETAEICGCALGTVKSRVNRARARLAELLEIQSSDDFGTDHATRGIISGTGADTAAPNFPSW
jgi:RNA polymerase sigma-70 factor, ECF subfamily